MVSVTSGHDRPYPSRVDDLQRPPADGDRQQIVARINRVHDEGRISTADRDIRLGNVRSAQSMAELDLMSRDLDQLEATLPPASAAAVSGFDPGSTRPGARVADQAAVQVLTSARRVALPIFIVVALVLAGMAALLVFGATKQSSSSSPEVPVGTTSEEPATSPAEPADAPGPAYSLSADGIRAWLATYRAKFGTSRVVDLTFYEDYVIVNVPVPGKARQSGWLYRDGTWTGFGGVRATFPGARTLDTRRLDIAALTRNIARARRTLHVERPAQAYVILRFMAQVDRVPSVDIHVSNQFQESGYLATTLDGTVERAYPYTR